MWLRKEMFAHNALLIVFEIFEEHSSNMRNITFPLKEACDIFQCPYNASGRKMINSRTSTDEDT